MKVQVGIDLGTTNSVVAYFEDGKIDFLKFRNKDALPSTLLYQKGAVIIGDMAKRKSALYPQNFIKSSKASMGDVNKEWMIEDRVFTPTDVASEVLMEIRHGLEKKFTGFSEFEAVITVPAYFSSSQIDETKKAGEQAGFLIKRIITEPVAAAIAYGIEDDICQKIFIVDVGGGTFDTSILEIKNKQFNTLSIDGDAKLGGDDFDQHILEFLLKFVRQDKGVNLASLEKSGLGEDEYRKAYQALVNKSEEIKIELSDAIKVDIEVANLFSGYNLITTIERIDFEKISSITLNKIERIIQKTLSGFSINSIDKVVLVGGSAKIPAIYEFVKKLFGRNPYSDKPLDKLVAMGAAILAYDDNSVQIKDIISHSLGIEVVDDKFSPILYKNTIYPIASSSVYTTTMDFQKNIDINVYEGEDEDCIANNSFYGGFSLSNIQQAPAGIPQVEVIFEFDQNRILRVTAKDLNTNSSHSQEIDIDKGDKKKITPEKIPFDIALLIDVSGSMCGDPLNKAKEACDTMISSMIDLSIHKIGLIEFESYSSTLSYLSNDVNALLNAVQRLSCKGGTDIADALREARQELFRNRPDKNRELVILVTDGGSSEESAIAQGKILKDTGVRVVTIGVGNSVNESLLKEIASQNDYYQIDTMDKLKEIFKKISSSLKTVQ